MFQLFQSPIVIWSIIMCFFLFFFVLFLRMLPGTNTKHQISTHTPMKVTKENHSECKVFGLLEKLPNGGPIPDECMSCRKLVECVLEKRAFDWYIGQNSAQGE